MKKEPERWRTWRAREREPITGVWGGAPSGVQGQSPWSGGHFEMQTTNFRRKM